MTECNVWSFMGAWIRGELARFVAQREGNVTTGCPWDNTLISASHFLWVIPALPVMWGGWVIHGVGKHMRIYLRVMPQTAWELLAVLELVTVRVRSCCILFIWILLRIKHYTECFYTYYSVWSCTTSPNKLKATQTVSSGAQSPTFKPPPCSLSPSARGRYLRSMTYRTQQTGMFLGGGEGGENFYFET